MCGRHFIRWMVLAGILLGCGQAGASVTTAFFNLGAPGTYSSDYWDDDGEPLTDPVMRVDAYGRPLLSDDSRPWADLDLLYDSSTGYLTIDIYNVGPSGSLTGLWLNVPTDVTGATLATAGTGTPPYNVLKFDPAAVMGDGHGFKADGFGYFDLYVGNSENLSGGDPRSILVEGSESVVIAFTGTGLNLLTASSFLSELSVPPPPDRLSVGAGKFQAGLLDNGSAWISGKEVDEHGGEVRRSFRCPLRW